MNIYEKDLKILQKEYPNFDSSVTVEDVKRAIRQIQEYLDFKPYATDRESKLRLIKRLSKLIGRT